MTGSVRSPAAAASPAPPWRRAAPRPPRHAHLPDQYDLRHRPLHRHHDPHEQEARVDGPFVAGGTGWSKPRGGPGTSWAITEVVTTPRLTWRAELDARLRPLGISPTVLAAVGRLVHLNGPPTQQEAAEQAGADRMMTYAHFRGARPGDPPRA